MLIFDSPKTESSIREIPIPSFLIPYIEDVSYSDNSYLLTNTSSYMNPRTLTNYYKKILKECGISSYTFHTLRHTFATRCIESGGDPKTLSEILGHSSIRITLERYVHPSYHNKELFMSRLKPLYTKKEL